MRGRHVRRRAGRRRIVHVLLIAVGFLFASSSAAFAFFSISSAGTYGLGVAGALAAPTGLSAKVQLACPQDVGDDPSSGGAPSGGTAGGSSTGSLQSSGAHDGGGGCETTSGTSKKCKPSGGGAGSADGNCGRTQGPSKPGSEPSLQAGTSSGNDRGGSGGVSGRCRPRTSPSNGELQKSPHRTVGTTGAHSLDKGGTGKNCKTAGGTPTPCTSQTTGTAKPGSHASGSQTTGCKTAGGTGDTDQPEATVVLTWTPPTNPPGTTWLVKETGAASGSGSCFTTSPSPLCTVTGLSPSSSYTFVLTYTLGSWSATSNTARVAATVAPKTAPAGASTAAPPPVPMVPSVSGLAPATGSTAGGTSVTITGEAFTATSTVKFGTAAATGVTVEGTTTIVVTVPAHVSGPVPVVVSTAGGFPTSVPAGTFTYATPPTVPNGPAAGSS